MPLTLNLLENLLFLKLNQGPGPFLDIFAALGHRIVQAAIELGVFEALSDGPLSVHQLAGKLGTDEKATGLLLNALEPLGYVKREGEEYRNTAMTDKWLARRSPTSFAAYYRYWADILPTLYGNLEESIRSGKAPVNLYEWIENQPETSRHFQEGMIAIARSALGEILGAYKPPSTLRRLLDIGGGHGTYSIGLCRKYAQLSATIFDSPQALESGRRNVAQKGMEDRIAFQEGNFVTDESLGTGYDGALVFNIIHGFSLEQNTHLFHKVARALNPGGQIVILDQLQGQALLPLGNAINSILGLTYFHLLDGQVYRFEDVVSWLRAGGFGAVRRADLRRSGSSLITASLMA